MSAKAVVLLSGGMDSAVTLALAKRGGFSCYAITFRYGQRHSKEIEAAKAVATHLGAATHTIVEIDLSSISKSALTSDIEVPKDRIIDYDHNEIPVTYVPARNTIFLSLALGYAETIGAYDIFLGVNAVDFSGYPDCRLDFIKAFENMANLATKIGVEGKRSLKIHAPLISMTKGEIVRIGRTLGVDFSQTWSCYDPDESGKPCGRCDACRLRKKGFDQAGMEDPLNVG